MAISPEFSTFEHRQDLGILIFRWLHPVGHEQIINGYSSLLTAHDPTNIQCWLFDTRRRGLATPESEAWYLQDFLPAVHQQLTKPHFIAVLLTPDHFQHVISVIGLQKFTEANEGSLLKMQFFVSELLAVEWLQNSKNE